MALRDGAWGFLHRDHWGHRVHGEGGYPGQGREEILGPKKRKSGRRLPLLAPTVELLGGEKGGPESAVM